MSYPKTRISWLRWIFLFTLLCGGCGRGPTVVTGTVTFKGQLVSSGHISFLGPDGRSASGQILSDGTYTVLSPPTGQTTVLVDSKPSVVFLKHLSGTVEPVVPSEDEYHPEPKSPKDVYYLPLPEKYKNPRQSGLTYTVRRGKQAFDIDLQP